MRTQRLVVLVSLVAALLLVTGSCSDKPTTPTAPSPASGPSQASPAAPPTAATPSPATAASAPETGSLESALVPRGLPTVEPTPDTAALDVAFPPRDQSLAFGIELNATYRDQLRRSQVTTYVDLEGWIVWIQEYLRYRVNGCTHSEASYRVGYQIGGGGVLPVCQAAGSGPVAFPPRDQTMAFGQELNDVYRDYLRRSTVSAYVDLEGWVVWIQEYLRYRVNACSHSEATYRVGVQIAGGGVPPACNVGGATIEVRGGSNACNCWYGTITVYVDGTPVGTLTCTGSMRVSVSPGTHTVRSCDSTGCGPTSTVTLGVGSTVTITLGCGAGAERVMR